MAKARLKGDGRVVAVTPTGRERPLKLPVDWMKVDATSEQQIARQIVADDEEARKDAAAYARKVRARTKLSQKQFAKGIGVPVETVRNWEQGKRMPRGPARALLRIIGNAPEIAFAPLSDALSQYVQTGYMSDELIVDRHIENARDEIEEVEHSQRLQRAKTGRA
jgi:putative transcriptional regulator